MATACVRWLIVVIGVAVVVLAIVYHQRLWQSLAGIAAALVSLAWSLAQKVWAARREWLALLAPPPVSVAPATQSPANPAAEPVETTMNLMTNMSGVLTTALASLPSDTAQNIANLIGDGLSGLQGALDAEIEAAKSALPPWAAPYKDGLASLAEAEVENARAALEAKIANAATVKAALGLPG